MRFLADWFDWPRRTLMLQFAGTVIVLGWMPGNGAKLLIMIAIWAIGFRGLTIRELATAALLNLIFVAMDVGALRHQIFSFRHADFLGLPVFEFFMWGFYGLHAVRFLKAGPADPRKIVLALVLGVAFSAPFSLTEGFALLSAAGCVLLASLIFFHEPMDFAFTAYMAAMGAVVEYVGVGTGQWFYPDPPPGGVPWWSFVMWAGIGLFSRRLIVPMIGTGTTPGAGIFAATADRAARRVILR
jgi:hypothetical protein